MTAQSTDDDFTHGLQLGWRLGRDEARKARTESHDQAWWSGWCWALVIGTLSGVALALVLQRVI